MNRLPWRKRWSADALAGNYKTRHFTDAEDHFLDLFEDVVHLYGDPSAPACIRADAEEIAFYMRARRPREWVFAGLDACLKAGAISLIEGGFRLEVDAGRLTQHAPRKNPEPKERVAARKRAERERQRAKSKEINAEEPSGNVARRSESHAGVTHLRDVRDRGESRTVTQTVTQQERRGEKRRREVPASALWGDVRKLLKAAGAAPSEKDRSTVEAWEGEVDHAKCLDAVREGIRAQAVGEATSIMGVADVLARRPGAVKAWKPDPRARQREEMPVLPPRNHARKYVPPPLPEAPKEGAS